MDIRDVARRAKVSTATVSRTVNRVVTVDAQLAKRVWKAIAELGYYPNRQARALVSGRSRVFGLIVSEITNPFFPEIVQTFETLAVEKNYDILLTSTIHHLQTDLRSYNDKIDHYKHVEFRVTGPETRKRAGGGVITRECLTNIHRDSGSSTALVRLLRSSEEIKLEVSDDGKGLDQARER